MQLRDRIRSAREQSGLSRAALARRIGVRPSAAVQWESVDGTKPSVENLTRIASALGIRFEWLATGRGAMQHIDEGAQALVSDAFAHDSFEERILVAVRRIPKNKREAFAVFLEALVK